MTRSIRGRLGLVVLAAPGGQKAPGPKADVPTASPGPRSQAAVPSTSPTATPAASPAKRLAPDDRAFQTRFTAMLRSDGGTDYETLADTYPVATETRAGLAYEPTAAAYDPEIRAAFHLTLAEEAALSERGFMVSDRARADFPAEIYRQVFVADLPVLITADSILHALHRSFDGILQDLEQHLLSPLLSEWLSRVHVSLVGLSQDGDLAAAVTDADAYLAVARSLLSGATVPAVLGNDGAVAGLLAAVGGRRVTEVDIFGTRRVIDFTQFQPRRHYTHTVGLGRYFQAMMWLGRVDLRLREFDSRTGAPLGSDRQIRAMAVLGAAVDAADAYTQWRSLDDRLRALIGAPDAMDLAGWRAVASQAGLTGLGDLQGPLEPLHAVLDAGGHGRQRISAIFSRAGSSSTQAAMAHRGMDATRTSSATGGPPWRPTASSRTCTATRTPSPHWAPRPFSTWGPGSSG